MGTLTSPVGVEPVEHDRVPSAMSPVRRDSMLRRLLVAGDAVTILGALACAFLTPRGSLTFSHDFVWSLAAVPIFILMFKLYGLYDLDVKRISHTTVDDLPWLFHALLVGSLLFWLYSKVSPMRQLDFLSSVVFVIAVLLLAAVVRSSVRRLAARHLPPEPALLVGDGPMAGVLVRKLASHPEYRLDIVGMLLHRRSPDAVASATDTPLVPGLATLGDISELSAVVSERGIGRVVVSPRGIDEQELEELLRRCRRLYLKVTILPALSDALGAAVEVDDVEGVTVLGVNPPWLSRSSRALKRVMDLIIAGTMLVLCLPLMTLIAILIKLDSPGPVFFAQVRIGKGGRPFRLFKFRSMVVDAEARRAALLSQSEDENWLKLEHDPRVTKIGLRLRRLSLDELPQLWNVVRGEMSLVGPRPLVEPEDRLVKGWARGRLDLTPGITGYWQVLGRTTIPFAEMVKLDYLYVTNWSLWEDVRLILRTLPTVLGGRGSN
ncbi:MAG: sugar transferase [Solirubrobacteraceae bacterium]